MPWMLKIKRIMVPGFVAALLLVSLQSPPVRADSACKNSVEREGKTVFVDISIISRKNRAAKKMTKMHNKMAKQGWTVIDVAPYTENGDLQGFFVTYVRKCR